MSTVDLKLSMMLQAELVAQFLCCIPLATVEVVLAWLKPVVPEEEQRELLSHVSAITLILHDLSERLSAC